MRLLIIILLFTVQASATNYYVSNTGSDAANGLTTGTAWQTIAKVNGSSFLPGDSILFNRGDSWHEQLVIPSSGSAGNNIVFAAYGTGAMPVITGFEAVTGWTNVGNIWSATFSNSVAYQNTVMVNGVWAAKGRYPNSTYLTYSPLSGTKVKVSTLSGTPNYVGAEIAIAENNFIVDVSRITAQSVDTITFVPGTFYAPNNGFRVTIQNIESVLDVQNEWCIDSAAKILKVYSTTEPTVLASSIDSLVVIGSNQYITFFGLSFTGANRAAIKLNGSHNVTIDSCLVQYCGTNGIWSYLRSDNMTVKNTTIQDVWNTGIMNDGYADGVTTNGGQNAYIYRNEVKRCGLAFGMGRSGFKAYIGIYNDGKNLIAQENRVDSIGYIGIQAYMDSFLVYRNIVSNYLMIKNDGAGVYTWANGQGYSSVGGRIISNIVYNSLGTVINTGIYLDEGTSYVTVDSNTVYNVSTGSGIYLHVVNNCKIRWNNIFNCGSGIDNQQSRQFRSIVTNNKIYLPIYSYNSYPFNSMVGYVDSLSVLGTIDSNYYSRPANEGLIVGYNSVMYDLDEWQVYSGRDLQTKQTPTGVTAAAPVLKINTTTAPQLQLLSGTYIDITGQIHDRSITLQPFQSAILFKATTDIITPRNLRNFRIKKVITL